MKKLESKSIENIIALTPLQEGMLNHYLQEPQGQLYFEQLSLEISGDIDARHFEKAWNAVIETNEMLRTVFRWEKLEKPSQVILKEYKCKLIFHDLSDKDDSRKKQALEEIKNKDRCETFDLHQVPFRVTLCKLAETGYEMIISSHHILYDGWSNGIILKEFFKTYHELFQGRRSLKLPAKPSFKKFIQWIHRQDKDKQAQYWREYLADFETLTDLPIKGKMEETMGTGDYSIILAEDISSKLDIFVKNNRVTLASVFYTAWGILLQKYCGGEDVVFGTTVSGRSADIKGIEDMVGLFINTVPLRIRTTPNEKIIEMLFQTDQVLREREKFENTPLVDIGSYSPTADIGSLFDTYVAVENYPLDNRLIPAGSSLSVRSYSIFEITYYDLSAAIMLSNTIEIKFCFKGELFKKQAIENLAGHFKGIIQNIIENQQAAFSQLEIISGEEKRRVLYDFNNTAAEYPTNKTIRQLFEEQASKTPDHVGVVGHVGHVRPVRPVGPVGPVNLTYRQLNEQANRLAHRLRQKGVGRDTIVAVMMPRGIDMVVAILAILKAGGAYLPVNPADPPQRILAILEDSGNRYLLTDSETARLLPFSSLLGMDSRDVSPVVTGQRSHIKDLDNLPHVDRTLVDYRKYHQFIGMAPAKYTVTIQATRGCPYHCTYCYKIWSKNHVIRSAENIFAEIRACYEAGVKRFIFIDDIFNLRKENSARFFETIIKHNYDVQLFFPNGLRGDILTADFIDLMIEAGTVNMALALETASPRMQKLINKGLNLEKFAENLHYITQKHPQVILEIEMMIGFPTETEAEALMTLDFLKRFKWIHFPNLHILKIFPNTDMGQLALQSGISRESINRSTGRAFHELPETLPFPKQFVREFQARFMNDYFLSKERLTHVLKRQVNVLSEDELVQKYDSYLPVDIKSFNDILACVGISKEELGPIEHLPGDLKAAPDFSDKIKAYYPSRRGDGAANAFRVLLMDISQSFRSESSANMLYDVAAEPLGLMYLATYLHKQFGPSVEVKILKSRIDFDSYAELEQEVFRFNPHLIGIRTLSFYKEFFHRTVSVLKHWGVAAPIITGGPYATSDYRGPLQDYNVDLSVLGEGEFTLAQLVQEMMAHHNQLPPEEILKTIPGLAFIRRKDKIASLSAAYAVSSGEVLLMDYLSRQEENFSTDNPEPINRPGDLFYMISTSGSTGRPKGVMVKQEGFLNLLHWYIDEFQIREKDNVLLIAPVSFDLAQKNLFCSHMVGGRLILADPGIPDYHELSELIRDEQITIINCAPSVFYPLIEFNSDTGFTRLKSLRLAILGGEPIQADKLQPWVNSASYRCEIINTYGPTEGTDIASFYRIPNETLRRAAAIPIGKPIPNARVFILDKYLAVLPVRIPGELCIGGIGLSRGYANNALLTGDKFIETPHLPVTGVYRTGDLTRWLEDGNIEFLGRIDQQVKIRGFRIEPAEIERLLLKHKDIKDAVVEVNEGRWGNKSLTAYIVSTRELPEILLREYLLEELPDYMIPSYFVSLEKIPLTPNGKIDRRALPGPGLKAGESYTAPRDEIEKKLAEIWSEVLGRDELHTSRLQDSIGIDDHFFDLGGHSLKAALLAARIHKKFNVNIPLREIFSSPVLKDLAHYIKINADHRQYILLEPVEKRGYYVLSSAQKRLYILQQMDPDSTVYHLSAVMMLIGELDRVKFERVFQELIQRHESLRTSFHVLNGEPVQRTHNEVEFEIDKSFAELFQKRLPEGPPEAITKSFIRPFDLTQAPLLRVSLIKEDAQTHILMIDMNHLISDGTSIAILKNEFMALFAGKDPGPLRVQYRDWAQWQNHEKNCERLKKQGTYWLREFEGKVPVLNIPCDYTRPVVQDFSGKWVTFAFSTGETEYLNKLAQQEEVTLYMLLFSAYYVLLYKLTNQEDIIVGAPTAGRFREELQNIIGMFLNTLALRNFPGGDKPFKTFLQEVKTRVLNAFENQEYQFDDLIDRLEIKRGDGRNPLFDVMFILQNLERPEIKIPGLELRTIELEHTTTKFDFSFYGEEVGNELSFIVTFRDKLFTQATITTIIDYYKVILSSVLKNPGQTLAEVNIISEERRTAMLSQLNRDLEAEAAPIMGDGIFQTHLQQCLLKYQDNIALEYGGSSLSYAELDRGSNVICRWILNKGIAGITFIGMLINHRLQLIITLLGIIKAGCVIVPLYPGYPTERLEEMIQVTGLKYMFIDQDNARRFQQEPGVEFIDPACFDFDAEGEKGIEDNKGMVFYNPEDPLYIHFTSGSTGEPKATLGKNRGLLHFISWEITTLGINPDFHAAQFTIPGFDPFLRDVFAPLLAGGVVCIPANEDIVRHAARLAYYVEQRRISLIHCVTGLFRLMISSSPPPTYFRNLKYILLAGEKTNPSDLVEWYNTFGERVQLLNCYGPTETTMSKAYYPITPADIKRERIPVGKSLPGARIIILADNKNLCAPLAPGEICIRTPFGSRGYFNAPGLNREKFIPNPFGNDPGDLIYRSGDLGRILADGNLDILGRTDRQVKIRGYRVEPGDIEHHLLKHPEIKDALVLPLGDDNKDSYLCAYIIPRRPFTVSELREYLAQKLPDYMIPAYFVQMERFPLTARGKIDRGSLPEPGIEVEENIIVPANETEKKLLKIWAEVLRKDESKISVEANFIDLGGHSLKAATLAAKIHKEFNANVPLAEFFKAMTIRGLSQYIKGTAKEQHLEIEPAEKKWFYQLSSAQKRLYFLQVMEGISSAYNIPRVLKLEGRIDVEKLANAFVGIIRRHESLRTSFHMVDEEPMQRIHDHVEFEIEFFATDERCPGQTRTFLTNFIRPFDLSQAPLLRVGLVKLAEEEHILLVDMHHIISDGVSLDVLVQDFSALYPGKELPEMKLQYKDYAEWQNRERISEKVLAQGEYWKKQFEGEIPVLELPTDYARPDVQAFEGDRINFALDSQISGSLQALALEVGASLYIVLLALYAVLLAKLGSREDIIIGSPVAGRRHADLEKIIGMFVNTLALRIYPAGEKNFSYFLQEVKEKTLKDLENQEYQYEDLMEEVAVTRDLSRNPLFDTMFALQNTGSQKIDIPGLKLLPCEYENKTSKFDFSLTAVEVEEGLLFTFEYCTKLFKRETVELFVTYFNNIIRAVLENKRQRISDFEIITAEEKERILFDFNNSYVDYPKDKTIHGLFAEQVEQNPDRIALVGADPRVCPAHSVNLTYRQLNEQSDRLAGLLIEKGVLADNIVGIMMKRSLEMVIGVYGILKAGGAYLPIDPDYPQERIQYMLEDSNAKILVGMEECQKEIIVNCQLLIVNCKLKNMRSLQAPLHPSSFITHHSNQLAYIIYTSGSTGKPKGVLIEHAAVVNRLFWVKERCEYSDRDVILQAAPLIFDVSVCEMFRGVPVGASLCLLSPGGEMDPEIIVRTIERYCTTTADFAPSMINLILDQVDKNKSYNKLASLRWMISGIETVSMNLVKRFQETLERFNNTKLINAYGPTESTVDVTYFQCSGNYDRVPIGKPMPNVQLYILGSYGNLQPSGICGELCIAGKGLARGYLNNPELTIDKFNRSYRSYKTYINYHTGDLARWLPDGNIEFLGRTDHQVKIRGFRVELGEIETRLSNYPGIKEVAVLVREEERGDKYLCAYIVPVGAYRISELREYLSKELPDYMIPSYFVPIEKIPLTPNGKVDRGALPKPELKAGDDYIAPRNEIEKKLVALWAEILGQTAIGIDDNFFQLGGHSLKATILVSKIHKAFEVKVELKEIFRTPFIRHIAELIRVLKKETFQDIEPVEKKEYYPLSSAQKRLYFLQQFDLNSTSYNMPMVLSLGQGIKKDKLEFALKQLIARHESLRTSFERVNDEVAQRIHESVEFEIEYFDLAAKNAKGREEVHHSSFIIHHFIHSFIRPFDLSRAPLIRSGLIMFPDGHCTWMVDIHHIVSDGTSHTILTEDFRHLYESGAPLEPLPIQYKDFAQWQNQLFAGGRIKEQEDYWLKLYAGEIPRLNLIADFKRPGVFTFEGGRYNFKLETEDAIKFKALAARYNGTLYMNMMAVLNTLFHKYTGQTDIIIGSGIAGRRHADIQAVVGMFVNTLAMRNYPEGEKSYENFLREVIANSVKGFENQDVQFEELVEKLDLDRDPSRNPLFDIVTVVQNFRRVDEDIQWEIINENHPGDQYKNITSKFDLTFFISESEDDVYINLEYYTSIFKEETIKRLAGHFRNIIHCVTNNPAVALKDIDILSETEKEQLLYEFTDTSVEFPRDKTIHRLFEEQAARTPDYVALIDKDQVMTYHELDRQANRLARYLCEEKKVGVGEPVGVWMSQQAYRQVAVLAIIKAGGAFVPLDPTIPAQRIKYIINDARIGVMISEKHRLRDLNRLQWDCAPFHSYLCGDSFDVYAEEEQEINQLMDLELWRHVGENAVDEITGGGWLSSYTGLPFSREEMDEYGDNILKKLEPLLHPGMKVLEIGCASGISMYRIAPKVGLYYGTDLSDVIIEKNKKQAREKGFHNIELACLPAHEIQQIPVKDFDLVIINSVIQCFHGHNYLRQVLQKAVDLLGNNGYLFIGDIMDQEKKDTLVRELTDFKDANRQKGYTTKTDFSSELFVAPGFWRDLKAQWDEIETVTCSDKLFSIENELTKFRYDVLIKVNKVRYTDHRKSHEVSREKIKYQDDMRAVSRFGGSWPGLDIDAGNLAYIIYTSGSTGKPKGVMVEHRSLVNLCHWNNSYYSVASWDRATRYVGFGFDVSVWEFFPYLIIGAAICIVPEEIMLDLDVLNRYFEKNGVTVSYLPTQVCEQFMELDNRSLRVLLVGGDKLRNYLKRDYRLYNNYGPTENTVVTTSYWVTEESVNIPIGKPIANNQVYILGSGNCMQPVGVPGELCIGGDGLAHGYLNNPELTADRFYRSDRTHRTYINYKTGDLARWLQDGNIEFLGRIDHQVKIRGFRIEIGEIENSLLKHRGIKEAVVVTREDKSGDKYLCAYLVGNAELSIPALRESLSGELPAYMAPDHFILLESLPLTASGKLDRKALLDPIRTSGERYIAPRDKVEEKLIEIWSEVLGIEGPIGIEDNFFELGGHSIKATVLASRISKIFKRSVPLIEIFKTPTIQSLAAYIRALEIDSILEKDENLVLLKPGMDKVLHLFFVHDGTGEVDGYLEFCKHLSPGFNCWGLRANRLESLAPQSWSIETLAKNYIEKIKKIQPYGPYFIIGWSLGGTIAFAMVRQLEQENEGIELLALVDSDAPYAAPTAPTASAAPTHTPCEFDLESKALPNFNQLNLRESLYYLNVAKTLRQAHLNYIPTGKVKADVHFFKAVESTIKIQDWENYCRGQIKLHTLSGDHFSIFRKPQVVSFAQTFNSVIVR